MDGLSVASSVAGIISLGIQVTQSLIDFYDAYKSQKSDLANTAEKLENLLRVFQSLRRQLTDRKFRAEEQHLLERIEGLIEDCEENVLELQTKIEKFKHDADRSIRAAVRTTTRQLAYPFRQSTLRKVEADIDDMVSNLSLALAVLQQKDIGIIRESIEDAKAVLDLVRTSQISSTIRDWLKAPDATINFNEACKTRHPGTGLWFVKGSCFSTWLVTPKSFLWLKGFAGCGKSVLCSTVIQHTLRHRRSNQRIGIGFFFFAFNDDSKQDASAMLRSLVLQLSNQLNNDYTLLSQLYERYSHAAAPSWDLQACLHQLVRAFEHVYIILDALDESPRYKHRQGVLEALITIREWSEHGLHLLVTSREEPDIRDVLREEFHASSNEIISMKNASIDSDIASFVSGHLKDSRELRKWEKYHDQIGKELTERAGGVFRWVECQFKALSRCASKRQLVESLRSLPRGLDETYERMLLNIDELSIQDARRVLSLLCCVKSPLRVSELIDATAVELGDNPQLNIDGRLLGEDEIHLVCPGLIEVDTQPDEESTVRLAHFSVQEYLESERILQTKVAKFGVRRPDAHSEIASICLTYLLEPTLSTNSIKEYPFASYAAQNWHKHLYDGGRRTHHAEHAALQLFQNSGGAFEHWVSIWNIDHWYGTPPDGETPSPVYYASSLGLHFVLSKLLCEDLSADEVSDMVNAQIGHYDYKPWVSLALEEGHAIAPGAYYGNALQAASYGGYKQVVGLLLEKGADVNARGGYYGNALQAASEGGYKQLVELLIEKGADVNAEGGCRGNALEAASLMGHKKVVELLLEKGADVNAHSGNFSSALQAASSGGYEQVVELLLEKGADVNAQDGVHGNALQAASLRGYKQVVKLLLDKGADVNAQDQYLENALQAASEGGHEQVVRLLLEKGANVNEQSSRYGHSALRAASRWGHEQVVKILLEKGAEVNAYGGSALQAASEGDHKQLVELLLEKGADVNATDEFGGTALQAASFRGYEQLVGLLLEKGADVNMQVGLDSNALYQACSMGRKQVVEILLEKGADVDKNALRVASERGHEEIVKLLLGKSADEDEVKGVELS